MALTEIVWGAFPVDREAPVWWLEGTARDEDGFLIKIKYRLPDAARLEALEMAQGGFVSGGFNEDEIIRWGLSDPRGQQ